MKAFRIIAALLLVVLFVALVNDNAVAQCAMCKGAINEKVTTSESNLGDGLNKGILYLMSFPYIIFGAIAFFWYRASNSKK